MLLAALLLGFGFATLMVHMTIPGAVAQIAGNQQLVTQVNQVLKQAQEAQSTRFTRIETRLDTIEKQKGK